MQRQLGAVTWLLFITAPAFAHDPAHARGQSPHAHGSADVQVAVEHRAATATLRIAGMSALGFEHAPRTPQEAQRFDDFRKTIARGDWLILTPSAGCRLIDSDVSIPGFDRPPDATDGAHAEFQGALHYDCADGGRLSELRIRLFDAAPYLQTINVEWTAPAGQDAATAERGREHVRLVAP